MMPNILLTQAEGTMKTFAARTNKFGVEAITPKTLLERLI
jgi:hypothetical protein